jgi:hypothetical protein
MNGYFYKQDVCNIAGETIDKISSIKDIVKNNLYLQQMAAHLVHFTHTKTPYILFQQIHHLNK